MVVVVVVCVSVGWLVGWLWDVIVSVNVEESEVREGVYIEDRSRELRRD